MISLSKSVITAIEDWLSKRGLYTEDDPLFSGKMNSEQLLINKWRYLNSVQQQEVLDFVDFIAQKSFKENQSQARARRVKQWIDWASDNPDDSPGLNDEALSRDSIYSED